MSQSKRDTEFPSFRDLENRLKRQLERATNTSGAEDHALSESPDQLSSPRKRQRHSDLDQKFNARPKRLPLKIQSQDEDSSLRSDLSVSIEADPWQRYRKILSDDQAGAVTIAYRSEPSHHIVAIKKRIVSSNWNTQKLFRIDHPNIVCFIEIILFEEMAFFVYESILLSLGDLVRSGYGPLGEFELATICKDVVCGIDFVQQNLHCPCPDLQVDVVQVTPSGNIKIANVAESLVEIASLPSAAPYAEVGYLLFELMEPGSAFSDRKSLRLKGVETWSKEIRDFLAATQSNNGKMIKEHGFMERSGGPGCLKPYIEVAVRSRRA